MKIYLKETTVYLLAEGAMDLVGDTVQVLLEADLVLTAA